MTILTLNLGGASLELCVGFGQIRTVRIEILEGETPSVGVVVRDLFSDCQRQWLHLQNRLARAVSVWLSMSTGGQ